MDIGRYRGALSAAGPSNKRRACDACRARKARCDRAIPCSNCRLHSTECHFSLPVPPRGRDRTPSSNRYEEKVDAIDSRLVSMERMLQDLIARDKPSHQIPTASFPEPPTQAEEALQTHPCPLLRESNDVHGRTTLLAHSIHAKSIFEMLTLSTALRRDQRMLEALTALQNVIRSQSDRSPLQDLRFTTARDVTSLSLSDFEMPPNEAVEDVLGFANKRIPRIFLKLPMMDVPDFADLCRSVYATRPGFSAALFALVNGGLYYIFAEQEVARAEERVALDLGRFAVMCRENFEVVLENFHLSTSPSLEACQALALGAFHATELVKPHLCRLLSTAAAQMAQTLSYHRIPLGTPASKATRAKKLTFWNIFCLERSLALRLAHVPTLQDCDVLTTVPAYPEDVGLYSWHALWISWVDLSRFQGRVFGELYSGSAMSLPAEYRINQARKLAADITAWHERWSSFQHNLAIYFDIFQAALEATEVVYHGLLTITYRVIPPPTTSSPAVFSAECVISARKALELHHIAAARYKGSKNVWRGYINWTIISSPFAPFLIIFCEAVATKNITDLYSLSEFVSSIKPFSTVAEVTDRLYQLCAAFYNVLKAYLEHSQGAADSAAGGPSADSLPQQPEMEAMLPMQMSWMQPMQQPLYGADGGLQGSQMPGLEDWGGWPADDLFGQDFSMVSRW